MKKTNQKPIEFDLHLKYRCKKCGIEHWLSFRETSTKNFKIVCHCGNVYKVKRTTGIRIKFAKSTEPAKTDNAVKKDNVPNVSTVAEEKKTKEYKTISSDLLEKSVKLLLSYGFTKQESTRLVIDTYNNLPVDDYATLVKYTLQSIGEIDNGVNNHSAL